jgi:nucleotide-binding universal stress UspA family protein
LTEVTERIVGEKKPVDGLLIVSDSKQVDLIVVGARGASSLERLVLGSVSRSVVHGTSLPILVVRKSSKPTTDSAMQVLLACDRSEKSRAAAKLMQNLSWPVGTTGRVMTVNESLFANQVPDWLEQQARETDTEAMAKAWVEEHDAELEGLGEEMSELCTELPSIFRQRPPIVTEGHPAKQILQIIDQEQTDLVVVGARGLGPVKRLLLGSTSEHLLSHAPCSILIVRNQATP